MPKITITVNGVDKQLSNNISSTITDKKGYKYTHLKQVVSRLRILKEKVVDLSEKDQIAIISNALITERNIANFAAEQYAEQNQLELFDALTEIVDEIEELFEKK